ncbi:hypothetical protein [Sphingomonas sp. Leaf230]|uniref:hypothetical protein n=1 Tax=Sphingomonas sp. Leaf230 TaxID=1735694 RepID=UPI000ADBCF60|nr:hypothetical protein [Sphingomonas sp. Leaf230]
MKYPERMARRGAGSRPFHSAIATTFCVEFAAYEQVMLPQLMGSGATNFLLIADERMASMSLSDGSQLPVQLGRDYELASPASSDGLFHSKIVLQVGRKAGKLFVGSANITAAGLAGNAETVVELECTDEPSAEQEIVRSAWRYVSGLVSHDQRAARDALSWAADRAPWLTPAPTAALNSLADGSAIAFLARDGGPGIGRRFADLVAGQDVERLIVASPYWDPRLDALQYLCERLKPASATILLDTEGHEFPLEAARPAGIEFRTFPIGLKGRFKHAKFLIASTATHDHVLVGSANCTWAALGNGTFGGSNAEACIYRLLPRDRALAALGLSECMATDVVNANEIDQRDASPPIPLKEIASRKGGTFELEGDVLSWHPPGWFLEHGRLRLLGRNRRELAQLVVVTAGEPSVRLSFRLEIEEPERISFVVVEKGEFTSNPSHVAHRSVLRRRRREVATGSVAKAVATFDAGEDFDLWMHGAFDLLARADLDDRPPPIVSARPRKPDAHEQESPPQQLTYDEFMETRAPDARSGSRQDSALTGTHSDSVRSFLNMLVGRATDVPEPIDPDAWMDPAEEDPERELNAETSRAEAQPEPPPKVSQPDVSQVDAKQFERMVRAYATNVTSDTAPLGPGDVLRVRFWLMLLLHKARHKGLPLGLGATAEEQGWPRMALRVISAFFCGARPPITRLMIAKDYAGMPVDFLECWATVLWTLDAMEGVLAGPARHRQFLLFVQRARFDVAKVLGLQPAELASNTVLQVRRAMDATIGSRLDLATNKLP